MTWKTQEEIRELAEARWGSALQRIDNSSWLILNKAILSRLPLDGAGPTQPNDYVDEAKGCIFRVRELRHDEDRPAAERIADGDTIVRPYWPLWNGAGAHYKIGSNGCLQLRSVRLNTTAREHENMAYAAAKKPSFQVPKPLYHVEVDGKYAIFFKFVGQPMVSRLVGPDSLGPGPLQKLEDQMLDAVAEMAKWKAPSISGIHGTVPTYRIFECLCLRKIDRPITIFKELKECLAYMGHGPYCFLNGILHMGSIGIDENDNFIGLNDWAHCSFVPKDYIMAYIVCASRDWARPVESGTWPWMKEDFRSLKSASLAIGLCKRGFPNGLGSWESTLLYTYEHQEDYSANAIQWWLDADLD